MGSCRLKVKVVAKKPVWGGQKAILAVSKSKTGAGEGERESVCMSRPALRCSRSFLLPFTFTYLHPLVLYTPPSGFSSSRPRQPTSKHH